MEFFSNFKIFGYFEFSEEFWNGKLFLKFLVNFKFEMSLKFWNKNFFLNIRDFSGILRIIFLNYKLLNIIWEYIMRACVGIRKEQRLVHARYDRVRWVILRKKRKVKGLFNLSPSHPSMHSLWDYFKSP